MHSMTRVHMGTAGEGVPKVILRNYLHMHKKILNADYGQRKKLELLMTHHNPGKNVHERLKIGK